MDDEYLTLESPSQGFFRNKGSRFLAFAYPINNEEDVKPILSSIKKEYYDARHHCYAYKIGYNGETYRVNDDGEPSGTAGRPILGQLDSFGVTNVLLVVVRYFGGILLGTGGLTEAYKKSSFDALNNGTIVTKYIYEIGQLTFPYEQMNDVMRAIKDTNTNIVNMETELNCKITISIRKSYKSVFEDRVKLIPFLQTTW